MSNRHADKIVRAIWVGLRLKRSSVPPRTAYKVRMSAKAIRGSPALGRIQPRLLARSRVSTGRAPGSATVSFTELIENLVSQHRQLDIGNPSVQTLEKLRAVVKVDDEEPGGEWSQGVFGKSRRERVSLVQSHD